jgi:hypothetical protein
MPKSDLLINRTLKLIVRGIKSLSSSTYSICANSGSAKSGLQSAKWRKILDRALTTRHDAIQLLAFVRG